MAQTERIKGALGTKARRGSVRQTVVFNIALEDGIELVRVIHRSQDLEKAPP
jgi:hypothetical protein